jgi:glycosyltransferase involved in cell wall biosynthesis
MKIAQVAPLFESVPPKLYGGTERVVAYLTDALVALGHDVTLFASGDSQTRARLVPCCQQSLRLDPSCYDPLAMHVIQLQEVLERRHQFDIVHFHTDYLHFPFTKNQINPNLTTLHGRLDIKELNMIYSKFVDQKVVSISYQQRKPVHHANWLGNIYHGLPEDLYNFDTGRKGYFAFLGRISPEKRPDRAIELAVKAQKPLKVAAKIDRNDLEYYNTEIRHLLEHPLVEFMGEISEQEKNKFLGEAECLLFPIDWPEPFGMVMIEAMACGTPVIAFENGSVREVIDQGVTGYIVHTMEEAYQAVNKIPYISRSKVREVFEKRFGSQRMANDYLELYSKLIRKNKMKVYHLPDINKKQLLISNK